MDKEPINRINHSKNLARLDGYFYHGTYYREGVPQVKTEKEPVFPSKGTIHFTGKIKPLAIEGI